MNAHMGDNELTTTLAREAERFNAAHPADLSMDRVLARAGEIRRGRRMRASMVMAAVVLAVAVPVGITVLGNDPARTPTPAPEPDLDPIALTGMKTGDAPAIGYLEAGTLHFGDRSIPLGKGDPPSAIARIEGGFLVARSDDQGNTSASFYGDDGSRGGTEWKLTEPRFAVSPRGTVGAFIEPDGTVIAVQDGGARSFEVGRVTEGEGLGVAAIDGDNCSDQSTEGTCTVYVNDRDQTPAVWAVRPGGVVESVETQLQSVTDARESRLSGVVSATDSGSCSAFTSIAGSQVFSTCDEHLRTISPDGKHLLATQPYLDGIGDGRLTVVRADGERVLDLQVDQDVNIRSMVWEDADHVLALVAKGYEYAVIRFDLDGNREFALAPTTGVDDMTLPFMVPTV